MEPIDPAPARRPGNPNMVRGQPSLNPTGRPKGAAGMARYIAEQTNDNKELVDRLLAISRGDTSITREQREATLALLDRAVGKPITPIAAHVLTETTGAALPSDWDARSMAQKLRYLDDLEAGQLPPVSDE